MATIFILQDDDSKCKADGWKDHHLIIDEYILDNLGENKTTIDNTREFFNHLRQIFKSTWICLSRGLIEGPVVKTWDEFTTDLTNWFPDFYLPTLRYPLRGGAKIVQFAKETNDLLLQMPDYELQLSKLHMANVKIPYNLLPSYEPVMYDFEKFGEMLQQQNFSKIFQNFGQDTYYLIIINSNVLKENFDLNIDKVDTQKASKILAKLFQRDKFPLICYNKSKNSDSDIQNWIRGNKNCDLITDSFHATGFESESVIVFWTHTKSLSAISRATIKLVIVEANIGLTNIEKEEKYIKDKMMVVNWDQKEAFYFDDWSSTQHLMLRIKFGISDVKKPIEYEVPKEDSKKDQAPDYIIKLIKTSITTKFYPRKNRCEPIDVSDKDHAILTEVLKCATYSKFPFIDFQINCELLEEHELYQEICNSYDLNYYLKHPIALHIKDCFPICHTIKDVCISKYQNFVNIFTNSLTKLNECKTCSKTITKYNWIKHIDH